MSVRNEPLPREAGFYETSGEEMKMSHLSKVQITDLEMQNAKLREQLAEAQATAVSMTNEAIRHKQRAEAAEAKLMALAEQEPVGEVIHGQLHWYNGYSPSVPQQNGKLYAKPIQPVDVQDYTEKDSLIQQQDIALETMKEARAADKRLVSRMAENIAELERKLEEQKSLFDAVLMPRETSIAKLREQFLAQAREEGRNEAVPEGVLADVAAERARQHAKWDGVLDDRAYTPLDWHEMIADYNGWARRMACMRSFDKARTRYIQIAALAVAAVEAQDAMLAAAPKQEVKP